MTVFSRIRKIRRRDCTAFLGGIFFASFGYHLYLWFSFMGTQPRQPDAALGLIYSMNNHGWSYYLSATQAIQLGMLFYVFMALIILIAIAHGPNPVKLPWEKYTVAASGSGKYFFGPPPSIYLDVVALKLLRGFSTGIQGHHLGALKMLPKSHLQ